MSVRAVLALATAIGLGCADATAIANPSVADLVGMWEQTIHLYQTARPPRQSLDLLQQLPACPAPVCIFKPQLLVVRPDSVAYFVTRHQSTGDTTQLTLPSPLTIVGDSVRFGTPPSTFSMTVSSHQLQLRIKANLDSAFAVALGFDWPAGASSLEMIITQHYVR